jgi:hypothetical protein
VPFTAPFGTLLVACAIEENPAHRLGRGSKEMSATVPALDFGRIDEPEIRLVDEGGGLERMPGLFLRQLQGGQLAQFVVHERQELLGGLGIALLDGRQDSGYVAHQILSWSMPAINRCR